MASRRRAHRLALAATLALVPTSAQAWPAELLESLCRDGRRLLPRSLAALLADRERQVLEEASRLPPELGQAVAIDLLGGRLQPSTVTALEARADEALALLQQRRVDEGVTRLGALCRVAADLSDPVLLAGPDGYAPGVVREYYAFVSAQLTKIPVVLEDSRALTLPRRDLPAYWQALVERSRGDAPLIATGLFQGGRLVDHRTLDWRSPVFAVGSLAYSRAVTAIAATWLAVWREARGDLTRMRPPVPVVPREPPSAAAGPPQPKPRP